MTTSCCRFACSYLCYHTMQAATEHGLAKHVNNILTCSRWLHVNLVVLGFPKRPHLPPLGTDLLRNDVEATMVDAKRQNPIFPCVSLTHSTSNCMYLFHATEKNSRSSKKRRSEKEGGNKVSTSTSLAPTVSLVFVHQCQVVGVGPRDKRQSPCATIARMWGSPAAALPWTLPKHQHAAEQCKVHRMV